MFPGTTILNYVFWMGMGMIQILVIAGAYEWLKHLWLFCFIQPCSGRWIYLDGRI